MNHLETTVRVLGDIANSFMRDECPLLAAAIAYYALLSIFPLGLMVATLAGLLFSTAAAQDQLAAAVATMVPKSEEFVRSNLAAAVSEGGSLGPLALVGLLWSASGFFLAVERSTNIAWGVERRRSFWGQRLMAAGVLGLGAMVRLGTMAANPLMELAQTATPRWTGLTLVAGAAWHLLALLLDLLLFAGIYRYLPNTRVAWRDVWTGAACAAAAFAMAKGGFVWYVTERSHYAEVYGLLASAVAFLVWAYLVAAILLFGAEICVAYRHRRPGE